MGTCKKHNNFLEVDEECPTARNLVTLPKFVILAILGAILGLFAFLMFTSGEASAAFPYPYYLYAPRRRYVHRYRHLGRTDPHLYPHR